MEEVLARFWLAEGAPIRGWWQGSALMFVHHGFKLSSISSDPKKSEEWAKNKIANTLQPAPTKAEGLSTGCQPPAGAGHYSAWRAPSILQPDGAGVLVIRVFAATSGGTAVHIHQIHKLMHRALCINLDWSG